MSVFSEGMQGCLEIVINAARHLQIVNVDTCLIVIGMDIIENTKILYSTDCLLISQYWCRPFIMGLFSVQHCFLLKKKKEHNAWILAYWNYPCTGNTSFCFVHFSNHLLQKSTGVNISTGLFTH